MSALLRGITSKNNGDLNYFHSFRTDNKLKYHENACKKDFFGITSPT